MQPTGNLGIGATTSPACGEAFPTVRCLALATLLLVAFRGLFFAAVFFRVALLALAGLRLVTFREVFLLVVLFRMVFLALLRRVVFLAAISARSLFDW